MCTHVHTPKGGYVDIYTRTFYILHSAVALEEGVVLSDLKILDNTGHNYGSHSKNSMNSVWKCFKISALTCSGRRMGRILGVLDKKKRSENILIFMVHEHFVWNITGMHRDILRVLRAAVHPGFQGVVCRVSDGKRPIATLRRTNARAVKFQFHYA